MFDADVANGRNLVFVQGLWRSGTSWVGQMIDSDPAVYICPHELQSFMRMLAVTQFGEPIASNPFLQVRHAAARKTAFLAMLLHLQQSEKPGARLIGERSPGADVWLLKENFPEAKLVIMLRDGRDICVSSAHLAAATGANRNLIDASSGKVQLDHVIASALAYGDCVPQYFSLQAAHPDDVLLVHYEDLHRDTLSELTKVFAFLGLAHDRATIEAICRTHALSQKDARTTNRNDAGFWVRKGAVGDWRKHLDEVSIRTYEAIAGPALQQAGYARAGAPADLPFRTNALVAFDDAFRMLDEVERDLAAVTPGRRFRMLNFARRILTREKAELFARHIAGGDDAGRRAALVLLFDARRIARRLGLSRLLQNNDSGSGARPLL